MMSMIRPVNASLPHGKEAKMETITKEAVKKAIYQIFSETEGRGLSDVPLTGKTGRLVIFEDAPLIGFGDAADPLFDLFCEEGVIGPLFMKPGVWLPGARTVISVFFPFSSQVKASNDAMEGKASTEWAYARIEGQQFIIRCMQKLSAYFDAHGIRNCIPVCDKRFTADSSHFISSWSERHAAYVCGLGTFGMSRGLITKKGVAGRFASILIDRPYEADIREYTDIFEYCTRCRACAARCPGNAIPEDGPKIHELCYPVIRQSMIDFAPRYGCGLCQTKVPCESGIPGR